MKLKGTVWKFGDDVDTDAIIAARYLNTSDPEELAQHVMEDVDPHFVTKIKPGDIIVTGKNFGCGSSREHAPLAIKHAQISAVVAGSFARIFYRNSFNMGLPILESPEVAAAVKTGDMLEIDLEQGTIINCASGESYQAQPVPRFMQSLLEAGGLVPYVREKLKEEQNRA